FRAVCGLRGLSTCWLRLGLSGLGVGARLCLGGRFCRLAVWGGVLLGSQRLLALTGFSQLLEQRIEGLILGLARVLGHRACAPAKPNSQSEGREKRAED